MEKQEGSKPPDYSEVFGNNSPAVPVGGHQPYPPGPPQYAPPGQAPGYTQTPQPYFSGYTTQYGQTNVVVQQPMMHPGQASGPPPQDYMCQAIFVTLCCFWPTGIIAIMKANDARVALARHDIVSAQYSAQSAKKMVNISIGVGIITFIIVAVVIGLYIGLVLVNVHRYS